MALLNIAPRYILAALCLLSLAGCAVTPSNCAATTSDRSSIRARVAALISTSEIPHPDWSNLDQEFIENEHGVIDYTAYFKAPPLGSVDIRFDCRLEPLRVHYNKYGEFSDYEP
jgi:hypothetical protein